MFWSVWHFVYVVFKAVQEAVKDLASEVHAPVKKLQVSEKNEN